MSYRIYMLYIAAYVLQKDHGLYLYVYQNCTWGDNIKRAVGTMRF